MAARVIVTRPEPDAGDFARALKKAGLTPVLAPVIRIEFGDAPPSFDGVRALAVTSANGVRALATLAAIPSLPVFAVGRATAESAREAGFKDVTAANGAVASLAETIARNISGPAGGAVLHVSGKEAAGDLVALLGEKDIPARRVQLYHAKPVAEIGADARDMLEDAMADDWATFFSPRTARLFIELASAAGLATKLRRFRAACLSEAVAVAARKAAWRDVVVGKEQSADALIAAIVAAPRS